jgi:hypothetical protein
MPWLFRPRLVKDKKKCYFVETIKAKNGVVALYKGRRNCGENE